MNRREIIAGLRSAAAWPVAARAQQVVRRIGVLLAGDEKDPIAKPRISAFTQALADLGWTDGRNVRIDLRLAGGDINRIKALAQELVGLQPDIILTNMTLVIVALQRETIPIVFAFVGDPIGSGIVRRRARGCAQRIFCIDALTLAATRKTNSKRIRRREIAKS
jgi:putative ABC transport system substrate-binding protein